MIHALQVDRHEGLSHAGHANRVDGASGLAHGKVESPVVRAGGNGVDDRDGGSRNLTSIDIERCGDHRPARARIDQMTGFQIARVPSRAERCDLT